MEYSITGSEVTELISCKKQALDTVRDLLGPEMTDQQWEGYKSGVLKRSREGQHGQNTL